MGTESKINHSDNNDAHEQLRDVTASDMSPQPRRTVRGAAVENSCGTRRRDGSWDRRWEEHVKGEPTPLRGGGFNPGRLNCSYWEDKVKADSSRPPLSSPQVSRRTGKSSAPAERETSVQNIRENRNSSQSPQENSPLISAMSTEKENSNNSADSKHVIKSEPNEDKDKLFENDNDHDSVAEINDNDKHYEMKNNVESKLKETNETKDTKEMNVNKSEELEDENTVIANGNKSNAKQNDIAIERTEDIKEKIENDFSSNIIGSTIICMTEKNCEKIAVQENVQICGFLNDELNRNKSMKGSLDEAHHKQVSEAAVDDSSKTKTIEDNKAISETVESIQKQNLTEKSSEDSCASLLTAAKEVSEHISSVLDPITRSATNSPLVRVHRGNMEHRDPPTQGADQGSVEPRIVSPSPPPPVQPLSTTYDQPEDGQGLPSPPPELSDEAGPPARPAPPRPAPPAPERSASRHHRRSSRSPCTPPSRRVIIRAVRTPSPSPPPPPPPPRRTSSSSPSTVSARRIEKISGETVTETGEESSVSRSYSGVFRAIPVNLDDSIPEESDIHQTVVSNTESPLLETKLSTHKSHCLTRTQSDNCETNSTVNIVTNENNNNESITKEQQETETIINRRKLLEEEKRREASQIKKLEECEALKRAAEEKRKRDREDVKMQKEIQLKRLRQEQERKRLAEERRLKEETEKKELEETNRRINQLQKMREIALAKEQETKCAKKQKLDDFNRIKAEHLSRIGRNSPCQIRQSRSGSPIENEVASKDHEISRCLSHTDTPDFTTMKNGIEKINNQEEVTKVIEDTVIETSNIEDSFENEQNLKQSNFCEKENKTNSIQSKNAISVTQSKEGQKSTLESEKTNANEELTVVIGKDDAADGTASKDTKTQSNFQRKIRIDDDKENIENVLEAECQKEFESKIKVDVKDIEDLSSKGLDVISEVDVLRKSQDNVQAKSKAREVNTDFLNCNSDTCKNPFSLRWKDVKTGIVRNRSNSYLKTEENQTVLSHSSPSVHRRNTKLSIGREINYPKHDPQSNRKPFEGGCIAPDDQTIDKVRNETIKTISESSMETNTIETTEKEQVTNSKDVVSENAESVSDVHEMIARGEGRISAEEMKIKENETGDKGEEAPWRKVSKKIASPSLNLITVSVQTKSSKGTLEETINLQNKASTASDEAKGSSKEKAKDEQPKHIEQLDQTIRDLMEYSQINQDGQTSESIQNVHPEASTAAVVTSLAATVKDAAEAVKCVADNLRKALSPQLVDDRCSEDETNKTYYDLETGSEKYGRKLSKCRGKQCPLDEENEEDDSFGYEDDFSIGIDLPNTQDQTSGNVTPIPTTGELEELSSIEEPTVIEDIAPDEQTADVSRTGFSLIEPDLSGCTEQSARSPNAGFAEDKTRVKAATATVDAAGHHENPHQELPPESSTEAGARGTPLKSLLKKPSLDVDSDSDDDGNTSPKKVHFSEIDQIKLMSQDSLASMANTETSEPVQLCTTVMTCTPLPAVPRLIDGNSMKKVDEKSS